MRIELRDHTHPCEHGFKDGHWNTWPPNVPVPDPHSGSHSRCPGGAVRVFEFNGTGRSLVTSKRGSGEFAGRRWQRWIEWAPDDKGTT